MSRCLFKRRFFISKTIDLSLVTQCTWQPIGDTFESKRRQSNHWFHTLHIVLCVKWIMIRMKWESELCWLVHVNLIVKNTGNWSKPKWGLLREHTKGAQWADAPLALLQQGWVISSVLLKKKIPNSWLLILYRIFQQMVEPSENEVMFKIMEIFRWIWKNQ